MGFVYVPDQPQVTSPPSPSTITMPDPITMLEGYIAGADRLKKLLKEEKKEDKEDDKKKKKGWWKNYEFTSADVVCVSFFLLATSPWTGIFIAKQFLSIMSQWATIIPVMPH